MPARKPPVIPAHETDVYRLLHGYEQRVAAGQLLGFATFKSLWQDMHFSHIFEGNATGAMLHEQYIQSLFAAAADGLLHSPALLLSLAAPTDAAGAASVAADVLCQGPADTPQGAIPTANGGGNGAATTSPALTQEQLAQLLDLSEDEDEEDVDVLGGSPPAPLLRSLAAGIAACGSAAQLDGHSAGNGITGTTAAGRDEQGGAAADVTASGGRNGSRQRAGISRKGRQTNARAAQQPSDAVQAPSHAGAAAAVFALHCLHELQAAPQGGAAAGGGPRVRAYLPLPALRAAVQLLADLRRDGPPTAERDVTAALAAMHRKGAFVVGALCRPASGSAAHERAARAKPRAAAADVTAEQALTREAKFFLNSTLEGLKGLQVVVGEAAPAYEAARDAVWQGAAVAGGPTPPPPIANLGLGPWLRAEVGRTMDGVKHALEGQGRKWLAAQRTAAGRSASAALANAAAEAEAVDGQESGLDDEIMASLAAADADSSDGDSGDPSVGGALAAAGLGGLGLSAAGLAQLGGVGAELRAAAGSSRSRGGGRGRGRGSSGGRGGGRARGGGRGGDGSKGNGRSAAGGAAAGRGGGRGSTPGGRGSGSRGSDMSAQQKAEARSAAERKRVADAEAAWQQALAAAQAAPVHGGYGAAATAATATSPRKRPAAASGAAKPSGRRQKSARVTFEADAAGKHNAAAAAAVGSEGGSSHAAAGSAQPPAPAAADSQAALAAGAEWPDSSRFGDVGAAALSDGIAASAAGQQHRSSRGKKRSAKGAAAKHARSGVTKRSRLAAGSSDVRQLQAAAAAAPPDAQPAAQPPPDGPAAGAVNVPKKKRRSTGGRGSQLQAASGGGSNGGIDAAAALAEHEALMAQVDAAMQFEEGSD